MANAEEFIAQMPAGFKTLVGERGVTLSGGQRQRLAIARAILRNPALLILDEATSALDYESERLIQEAFGRLSAGRTVITIAHRLSTIKDSDRIIVLAAGEIAEEGSYAGLVARGGVFARLIAAQSAGTDFLPE
jgi:ABC-type multidrug transport system fused ATPase/permease subunit